VAQIKTTQRSWLKGRNASIHNSYLIEFEQNSIQQNSLKNLMLCRVKIEATMLYGLLLDIEQLLLDIELLHVGIVNMSCDLKSNKT